MVRTSKQNKFKNSRHKQDPTSSPPSPHPPKSFTHFISTSKRQSDCDNASYKAWKIITEDNTNNIAHNCYQSHNHNAFV